MSPLRPGDTLFTGLPSMPNAFGNDGGFQIAQRPQLSLSPSDIDVDLSSLFYPTQRPGQSNSQSSDPMSQLGLLALLMLFLSYLFGGGKNGGPGEGAQPPGAIDGNPDAPPPVTTGQERPTQWLAVHPGADGDGPPLLEKPGQVGNGPSGPTVPFEDLIQGAASKYDVPAGLIKAVISQESNFDPKARNATSGCTGLMQLDPRYFGNGADLTDPALNIDLGTKELRRLLDKFGGDQARALTAYNLGEYADPNSIPAGQSITGVEYARQVLAKFA